MSNSKSRNWQMPLNLPLIWLSSKVLLRCCWISTSGRNQQQSILSKEKFRWKKYCSTNSEQSPGNQRLGWQSRPAGHNNSHDASRYTKDKNSCLQLFISVLNLLWTSHQFLFVWEKVAIGMKALHGMQPLFIKSVSKDCAYRYKLNEEIFSQLLSLFDGFLI